MSDENENKYSVERGRQPHQLQRENLNIQKKEYQKRVNNLGNKNGKKISFLTEQEWKGHEKMLPPFEVKKGKPVNAETESAEVVNEVPKTRFHSLCPNTLVIWNQFILCNQCFRTTT